MYSKLLYDRFTGVKFPELVSLPNESGKSSLLFEALVERKADLVDNQALTLLLRYRDWRVVNDNIVWKEGGAGEMSSN